MNLTAEIVAALVKILIIVGTVMLVVPMLVWLERKVLADFQARVGPERVGPFGLLQTFADGIKLLFKEDVTPSHVDKFLYLLAPVMMMIPALTVLAVVPFGSSINIGSHPVPLIVSDVPIGILYVLAITSLGVYGIVLSGWSSNNKYSLLGGLRSSAQMVSYELPMGMSIIVGVLIATTNGANLSLGSIVASQNGGFWNWAVFQYFPLGLLAALMYYTCGVAETNRAPFDLPEAETELIGGYHTEYGSMKWAMFFLGEYANMVNVSAILVTVFFGGWTSPIPVKLFAEGSLPSALGSIFWFVAKIFVVIMVYLWLRATLPRLRYDRLMSFAWKMLLPAALVMVLAMATWLTVLHSDRQAGERTSLAPLPAASRLVRIARPQPHAPVLASVAQRETR